MTEKAQSEISVYARVTKETVLKNLRFGGGGLLVGRVEDVARQYGIQIEEVQVEDKKGRMVDWLKFTAPKGRLQIFAEKLHFSRTPYFSEPY
jgi:hypothetical protein